MVLLLVGSVVLLSAPSPAAAQQSCPVSGSIVGQSVVASGCILEGGGGPDGTPALACTYDLLIGNDVSSSVGVYRSANGYATGSATGGTPAVEVTVNITLGGGSSLEFNAVEVSGADRQFSETGQWYRRFCDDENGNQISVDGPIPSGTPRPITEVLVEALAQLDVEAPPTFDHSGPASVLQLPTFFWLSTVDFTAPAATASATHGNLTVSVSAQPDNYVLEVDGVTIDCDDRNTPWSRGLAEDDPSACIHVFEDPADESGLIEVDLTLEFATSWSSNVPAFAGPEPLAPIPTITEDIQHELVEIVGLSR